MTLKCNFRRVNFSSWFKTMTSRILDSPKTPDLEEKKILFEVNPNPRGAEKSYDYDGCSIILRYEAARSELQGETSLTPKEGSPPKGNESKEDYQLVMDVIHTATQRRWRYTFSCGELSAKFPGITNIKSIEKIFDLLIAKHPDISLRWAHNPNDRLELNDFSTLGMILRVVTLLEENELKITLERVPEEFEKVMMRVVINLEEKINGTVTSMGNTIRRVSIVEHHTRENIEALQQRMGALEDRLAQLTQRHEELLGKYTTLSQQHEALTAKVTVSH